MGRIRTIKPEFWKHEELSELPELVHLFAAAILNYCDDEGFFNANPKLIKAELFPLREPSLTIHGMLSELSDIGYIKLFQGLEKKKKPKLYGQVVKFTSHQKVNRPQASKIKGLVDFTEYSLNDHEQITVGKEQGTGNREQGKEGKGTMSGKPDASPKQNLEKILDHLNARTGRNYRPVDSNTKLIQSRLNEGYTETDLINVINHKCARWLNDKKMVEFLRPATLFGKEKFSQYVGEVGDPNLKTTEQEIDDWANGLDDSDNDFIDGEVVGHG